MTRTIISSAIYRSPNLNEYNKYNIWIEYDGGISLWRETGSENIDLDANGEYSINDEVFVDPDGLICDTRD